MKKKIYSLLIFLFSLSIAGCNKDENATIDEDTPTQGTISISVDETLTPLMQAEEAQFEAIYNQANINTEYKTEADAMNDLLNGKVRFIVLSRKLNEQELDHFRKEEITPIQLKIAYDAIAVVLNPANSNDYLKLQELRDILNSKITKWDQLGKGSGDIQLIFDNQNSSVVRYMLELINQKSIPNKNSFARKSSSDVIDFVKKNKNAIGFLGVNWISDRDDSLSNSFIKDLKVATIMPDDTSKGAGTYYEPYQSRIAERLYPLSRDIYIISREARAGLGRGYSAFIAGEKGQRIVLKMGLVPATMPIRLVEIKNQNIEIERD